MNPRICFIDTGAFIALNNANDQHYKEAAEIASQIGGFEYVISDAILTETYTLLRYKSDFRTAHRFLSAVLHDVRYRIADITPSIRKLTIDLLEKYNDHKISYCDALSAAIMKHHEIPAIFSFDHHFELMGIRRLNFD